MFFSNTRGSGECAVRTYRQYSVAAMGEAPSPSKVVNVEDDHIVIQCGHAVRPVAITVRKVGTKKFWVIRSHDEVASLVITGTAACHRPLGRLKVWKEMRKKKEARDICGNTADVPDEEEEEAFNFGGEADSGADTATSQTTKKGKRINKKATEDRIQTCRL